MAVEGTLEITISNQVAGSKQIVPAGWHVPTKAEFDTLLLYLDPSYTPNTSTVAGGYLKEIGAIYWDNADSADNSSGFSAKGSGGRDYGSGTFTGILGSVYYWGAETSGTVWFLSITSTYSSAALSGYSSASELMRYGYSVRPIKDDSTDPGTVTDYDGNIYPTVKIGDQVWFASNLKVTHYNDGTVIPLVTDDAAWAALTTAGMCFYPDTSPAPDPYVTLVPESLNWNYNETDVKTFVVTTNMARWYFGSTCDYDDYTLSVWDELNTTQITDGVFLTGYYVRLNPTAANGGAANKYSYLYIVNALDEMIIGGTMIGTQTYSGGDDPPIVTIECNDATMTLSGIDHVLTIGSSDLWIQFTPAAISPTPPQTIYITVTKVGPTVLANDTITNCYNGAMRSKWITLSEPATAGENIYVQLSTSNA